MNAVFTICDTGQDPVVASALRRESPLWNQRCFACGMRLVSSFSHQYLVHIYPRSFAYAFLHKVRIQMGNTHPTAHVDASYNVSLADLSHDFKPSALLYAP